MESALSLGTSSMSILALSKALNSHFPSLAPHLNHRFSTTRPGKLVRLGRRIELNRLESSSLVQVLVSVDLHRGRLPSASYAASAGRGGGGDGAADCGDPKPSAFAAGAADGPVLSSDVIILKVGGMMCDGCAGSVKRILETQSQVSSASVNLTTETAIVWPISEAKVVPNWRKDLGDALAEHLSNCGFKSNLRDEGANDGDIQV